MLRRVLTLLAKVAPILLPSNLEFGECFVVYNPQRVLRQFEYDQAVLRVHVDTSFSNALVVESQFVG